MKVDRAARRIPGDAGAWIIILGDMMVFAILFLTYLYYRRMAPDAYVSGQSFVSHNLGFFNTLVLLTGSLIMALAVERVKDGDWAAARRLMACTAGSGVVFAIVKAMEWTHLIQSGHGAASGDYFMFYFVMTGFHFVHLAAATVFVVTVARFPAPRHGGGEPIMMIETAGLLWHLVDLLWIILFAILYLIGR